MSVTLICGDCLEILPTLPAGSVDLIATDPPYYRVKDEPWDRQWDSADGFLAWLDKVLEQFARVLKPNGSLYLFASPKMAARVEVLVGERFNVLNHIVWAKNSDGLSAGPWNRMDKDTQRIFFPRSERIIFAEHYGADGYATGYGPKCDELRGFVFEPLRAYLDGEWRRAGLTPADANTATDSFMAGHYFTKSQWVLPTRDKYEQLRAYANSHNNHGGEYLRREYEDLRREYEDLRREYEDLRRPFYATAERPYTDVWDFQTVAHYPGKHTCEKPLAMMEHIILTSSRPGAVVLDAFMGGGTTGEAAQKHGRDFIGIEMAEHWHQRASERLAYVQPALEGLR